MTTYLSGHPLSSNSAVVLINVHCQSCFSLAEFYREICAVQSLPVPDFSKGPYMVTAKLTMFVGQVQSICHHSHRYQESKLLVLRGWNNLFFYYWGNLSDNEH